MSALKPIRLDVSVRLIVSLFLAAVFTVISSGVAIDAFIGVRHSLEEITVTHLPAMTTAFQLAQQSEATVAAAPAVAEARTQGQRQTAFYRVRDQEARLEDLLAKLRAHGRIDSAQLSAIEHEKTRLRHTFENLNAAAERRIDNDLRKAGLVRRLAEMRVSLNELGDSNHIRDLDKALALLVHGGIAPHIAELERLQAEFSALSSRLGPPTDAIHRHIAEAATGTDNIFILRRRELEAVDLIQGLLAQHSQVSSRLVYQVSDVIRAAEEEIASAQHQSGKLLDRHSRLLVLLSFISILGVLAVAAYVSRTIISRLDALKKTMVAGAAGQAIEIDTRGDDEISDMAQALKVFITTRDQAEAALRQSEQRFRDVAEAASEWLWEMGPDLRFTYISDRSGQVTGLEAAALLGRTGAEVAWTGNGDAARWEQHEGDLAARRPFRDFRYRVRDPDGRYHYIQISGKPIFGTTEPKGESEFQGYRGTGTNITAEVEAEQRAQAAQRRLIDAVENIPEGFVLWDAAGKPMLTNSRYNSQFPPGNLQPEPGICRTRTDDRAGAVEMEINGRWLQIREHKMADGCTVGLFSDITELKHREQALRQSEANAAEARAAAEQANQAKTRFLAAASHDLRQPLQALGLFAAALAERPLDVEDKRVVSKIQSSLEALEGLLDALLDISKLDAGVVEPHITVFPVTMMLTRLDEEFAPLAQRKGLRMLLHDADLLLRTDATLLERVLRNLISNALRYTEEGGILVGCRQRGDRLRIEVWDTGRGIPPEHIRAIFREFHQLDNPARDRRKGLGLGLAIVERTAALLGTRIEVVSKPGRGSCFAITVPIAREAPALPAPEADNAANPDDFQGRFVIVIDDDVAVRDALRMLLEIWGCRVAAAESAADALSELQRWGIVPDAIVADYRLSHRKTGGAAIMVIRRRLGIPVPGILVTGDTAPQRLRQAQRYGFPLLHKPVRPDKLRVALHNAFLGHETPSAESAGQPMELTD